MPETLQKNDQHSVNYSHDQLQQDTPEGFELRLISISIVNYLIESGKGEQVIVIRETDASNLLVYLNAELSKSYPAESTSFKK